MKLAIIRRRYNPHGGAERFIERILPKFTERGIEPTIIAEQWDSEESRIPILKIKTRGLSRTAKFRSFQNAVQKVIFDNKLTKRFDLVQSHERTTNANIFRLGDGVHAAWISRLQKESSTLGSLRLKLDPYHRCVMEIERNMARDSNLHYVANSSLVATELQQYLSVPSDRISMIPNGIDVDFFRPASQDEKVKSRKEFSNALGININPETTVAIGVGSGFFRKGFFSLIRACVQLNEFVLLLCGEDSSAAKAQQLISRLGASRKIFLLGPRHDVRSAIWASDVFVLPSLYDPSSNAVLESLSCGVPVVITKDVGMAEEILQANAGILCSRETSSVTSALQYCQNNIIRGMMRDSARQYALRFDQNQIIQRWLDLYQSIQSR